MFGMFVTCDTVAGRVKWRRNADDDAAVHIVVDIHWKCDIRNVTDDFPTFLHHKIFDE